MGKLTGGGLEQQANSWVGTGQNEAVSADQIGAALPDEVNEIAAESGMDPADVSDSLSQLLPGLVNEVSPNGQLPTDQADLSQILSQIPGGDALAGLLGGRS